MPDNYLNFLDQRAAERRLAAKFSHPRLLMLHTVAFVGTVTLLWLPFLAVMRIAPLPGVVFQNSSLVFWVWSMLLATHALFHYRRSSARIEKRELVVESEMRQLIESGAEPLNDETLFTLHQRLSHDLEHKGWLSQALTVFALVNGASWFGAAISTGTTWGFQVTLPTALLLIGGVYGYRLWRHSRATAANHWITRFPLVHLIVFLVGAVALALLGSLRMFNPWDGDMLVGGWTIFLLLHILWSVVLSPLLNRHAPSASDLDARLKRKHAERLMLSDDGEIVTVDEIDAAQPRTSSAHHG